MLVPSCAGLAKFETKKVVKLDQLNLLNLVHDVMAAVAKAQDYLKCRILEVKVEGCRVSGFESCSRHENFFF